MGMLAKMHDALDWDDFRYFLAVQRAGSFAGAARQLQVDQATVGRRLHAFEKAVGTALFERAPGTLVLTEAGRRVLAAATTMDEAAIGLARAVSAGVPTVTGVLRITATETLATRVIAPGLRKFRERHPGLDIELHVANERMNLARREADIAVRLERPSERGVAARRVGMLHFAIYGTREYVQTARGYVQAVGRPPPEASLTAYEFVGYERALASSHALAWVDEIPGARVAVRCNATMPVLSSILAGSGLGALPTILGDAEATLVRVSDEIRSREIWLVVHEDLRRSARARAGVDFLATVFRDERFGPEPLDGAKKRTGGPKRS